MSDDTDIDIPSLLTQKELAGPIYRPDLLKIIDEKVESMSQELRDLSMDIHDHPELMFEEKHAHDVLTSFLSKKGFNIRKHYILSTGWEATFVHGNAGRTIGVNSEMDALPGIGHACGHNLIAIAGVAVACAMKAVLEQESISGKIVLLGTPAEEGGSGKVLMMNEGAYKDMDICLMCHPAPGPRGSVSLSGSLALRRLQVEYFGHTAHAALSPWEGQNALDAAVLAYNSVSVLRQQLKPTHRVHGVFEGKDWVPGIIPDYAKMHWYVRAPTQTEVEAAVKRVTACFEATALATACRVDIKVIEPGMMEIKQNPALGDDVANIVRNKYGSIDYVYGIANASTDFGNVTYELPSLHPGFAIPTKPNGGNHTPAFTDAAATMEAHKACLDVSKALAATGIRVLLDEDFFAKVKKTFEDSQSALLN